MSLIKILFLIAIIGHLLCGYCDCLITYIPGGKRFDVKAMSDNEKMRRIFDGMPLKNPVISMVLGCLALFLCSFGYYGVYLWMKQFSGTYAAIILISSALFFIPGTAHHVFCGAAEWFYVRLGMTEEARAAILEFFKSTSATMIACYTGLIIFAETTFIAVFSGATGYPKVGLRFQHDTGLHCADAAQGRRNDQLECSGYVRGISDFGVRSREDVYHVKKSNRFSEKSHEHRLPRQRDIQTSEHGVDR